MSAIAIIGTVANAGGIAAALWDHDGGRALAWFTALCWSVCAINPRR